MCISVATQTFVSIGLSSAHLRFCDSPTSEVIFLKLILAAAPFFSWGGFRRNGSDFSKYKIRWFTSQETKERQVFTRRVFLWAVFTHFNLTSCVLCDMDCVERPSTEATTFSVVHLTLWNLWINVKWNVWTVGPWTQGHLIKSWQRPRLWIFFLSNK